MTIFSFYNTILSRGIDKCELMNNSMFTSEVGKDIIDIFFIIARLNFFITFSNCVCKKLAAWKGKHMYFTRKATLS